MCRWCSETCKNHQYDPLVWLQELFLKCLRKVKLRANGDGRPQHSNIRPGRLLFNPPLFLEITREHTDGTFSSSSRPGSRLRKFFCFFSLVHCPDPPAGGAPEPPGPGASSSRFPESSARRISASSPSERLTCISACVYLLSHGERLGVNAVQWLSLSTMTYVLW